MSQENVEIAKRLNAAFNRGDRDAVSAFYSPDAEWRDLQPAPDSPERLSGVAAIDAYWAQWEDAFDPFIAEIEEYIDAGNAVVMLTHWRATGKGSDLVIDMRTADVVEFADRKIIRVTIGYADKDAALKAVGLEE